jgi:hypothetical protein
MHGQVAVIANYLSQYAIKRFLVVTRQINIGRL